METLARIGRWLARSNAGQITAVVLMVLAVMQYDPYLIPNLIAGAITWAIGLIVAILKANQKSIEYLFCIGLLIVGIRCMFRGVFRSGGGNKK